MANLIRLKQIESGSNLGTAATLGADFSASVQTILSQSLDTTFSASIVNIITNNVAAVLPNGVVSSSNQIDIFETTNFVGFDSAISTSFTNIYTELANITGSLETGLSSSVALSLSQSSALFNQFSASIHSEISQSNSIFAEFSASTYNKISQSNSIFQEFSSSIDTQISSSLAITNDISISVDNRLISLEQFSSSLDNGFATDAELTLTSSQILDQGEW